MYNGLPFEAEEDKTDMEKILDLMETYCIGELNVIYERYVFYNRNQATDETMPIRLHSEPWPPHARSVS